MSIKLTNNSGGQLVCDLAIEGKTLRLDNKKSKTINDNEVTPHIKNLVLKGLLLSEEVSVKETQTNNKKKATKSSNKEKEE